MHNLMGKNKWVFCYRAPPYAAPFHIIRERKKIQIIIQWGHLVEVAIVP